MTRAARVSIWVMAVARRSRVASARPVFAGCPPPLWPTGTPVSRASSRHCHAYIREHTCATLSPEEPTPTDAVRGTRELGREDLEVRPRGSSTRTERFGQTDRIKGENSRQEVRRNAPPFDPGSLTPRSARWRLSNSADLLAAEPSAIHETILVFADTWAAAWTINSSPGHCLRVRGGEEPSADVCRERDEAFGTGTRFQERV